MSDPFAARRRQAFMERMPDWTAQAACRDKTTIEGEPWEAAFSDADLTQKPSGEYRWPASTLEVMVVCATCPVQRPCLEYGFSIEEPILLGVMLADDETYERTGKPYKDEWLTPMPTGVYGGIPGPMRERFRRLPDRLERAGAWFAALCQERRWVRKSSEEVVA